MFRKAERRKAKLRLGLCGPSGSGKTWSALLIATGLGGKIAFIDSENKSGDLYANDFNYDITTLSNYDPNIYIKAIKEAENAGYDVLIIDSLSHAWNGAGGVLEMVDKAATVRTKGNSYTAWRFVTPVHNLLVDTILKSNLHIIVTLRTKTEYDLQTGENGKTKPVKIGLAPIQREGMDYEFTTVLDLSVDGHIATSSKDRTGIFDGKYELPTVETGLKLMAWLNEGVSTDDINAINISVSLSKLDATRTEEELKKCFAELWLEFKDNDIIKAKIKERYDEIKLDFMPKEVVNA